MKLKKPSWLFANLPIQYCRDLYLVKFSEMLFLGVTCVLFLVSKSSICHLSACLLTFHSHIEMVYGGPLNIEHDNDGYSDCCKTWLALSFI